MLSRILSSSLTGICGVMLVLIIISDDSSFRACVNILILLRLLFRIARDSLWLLLLKCFPGLGNDLHRNFTTVYLHTINLATTTLHNVFQLFTIWSGIWIRRSPKLLCTWNGILADMGTRVVRAFPVEMARHGLEYWESLTEEARQFCQVIGDWT